MTQSPINVLFVSRDNLARSILAEACLNQLGKGRFKAFSCGMPGVAGGSVPGTIIETLEGASIPLKKSYSKSWNEFTRVGASRMNFVISLDAASVRQHPHWPGQPETATWSTAVILQSDRSDAEVKAVALQTLYSLRRRLELLVALPMHGADPAALRSDIRDMAHMQ